MVNSGGPKSQASPGVGGVEVSYYIIQGRLRNSESISKLEKLSLSLPASQRDELCYLIRSCPTLFSDVPSWTDLLEHDIEVGEARHIWQQFYKVSPEKQHQLEAEVQYMLEIGIAKLSHSSWASPWLLIAKPSGTFRPCTDYHKVNTITKPCPVWSPGLAKPGMVSIRLPGQWWPTLVRWLARLWNPVQVKVEAMEKFPPPSTKNTPGFWEWWAIIEDFVLISLYLWLLWPDDAAKALLVCSSVLTALCLEEHNPNQHLMRWCLFCSLSI